MRIINRSSLAQTCRFPLLSRAARLLMTLAVLALSGLLSLGGCSVEPATEDAELADDDLGEDVATDDDAISINPSTCRSVAMGPIWSNSEASGKCVFTCGTQGFVWNGHWSTVATNQSVCGCCNATDDSLRGPDRSLLFDAPDAALINFYANAGHVIRGHFPNGVNSVGKSIFFPVAAVTAQNVAMYLRNLYDSAFAYHGYTQQSDGRYVVIATMAQNIGIAIVSNGIAYSASRVKFVLSPDKRTLITAYPIQ